MSDQFYYWDFNSEHQLEHWQIISSRGSEKTLECHLNSCGGKFVFLLPCRGSCDVSNPILRKIAVNGTSFLPGKDAQPCYIHPYFARYGFDITLRKGINILHVTLDFPQGAELPEKLFFSLIPRQETTRPPRKKNKKRFYSCPGKDEFPSGTNHVDLSGWTPGIGRENSPGRFGFTKGDGLLDCAMPNLGIVDKMFLCGQPRYRKPYRWHYSLLPPGMPLHGSYPPSECGIENDSIEVNHLSVKWRAEFQKSSFSCTYSLATPAILTENSFGFQRISNLRFAGNYQSVLIPRGNRVEAVAIDDADLSGMTENWLLFFECTEYPEIPLMVVLERRPDTFRVQRDKDGRLLELQFGTCSWMMTATPFGIESFTPGETGSGKWIRDAVSRCRFWSRAFLAYPVRCIDYFKINQKKETVSITQKFEYRYLQDQWGTVPLETAPLPPTVSLCGNAKLSGIHDFRFPTKYGFLNGGFGCFSSYELPFMPLERPFPLVDANSSIPAFLAASMNEYKHFTGEFSPEWISYPYAGAHLEPFAFASSMMFFMNSEDRKFLRDNILKRLSYALEENRKSHYPVIRHGEMMRKAPEYDDLVKFYHDPSMTFKTLWNWYDRKEPFTGTEFKICYLNLCYISNGNIVEGTPEEIRKLKIPLIENDWGVGLTFYYLYLCALAAGSFEEIRKKWDLIKKVYAFFDKMHDWACMGTGFSDNGITWVEGANYGLFPSFIHMAEAVGDHTSRDFGIYNAAKQFALRLAILRSSLDYFPRCFKESPWFCTKAFQEENIPGHGFQNIPALLPGRLRPDALYNITTEGLYPEAFTALRKFGGKSYRQTFSLMRSALLRSNGSYGDAWGKMQQFSSILIDEALNRRVPPEKVMRDIDEGIRKGLVIKRWRGIHIYTRALPENYFHAQLLAWLEMRKHKLWLEHWEAMRIEQASWQKDQAVIVFGGEGKMRLICGTTCRPYRIFLNGKKIPFHMKHRKKIELFPSEPGCLVFDFRKEGECS